MRSIEKSHWFDIIHKVIEKAFLIYQTFTTEDTDGTKSKNVLIYCQNGSSASCVISSLAQILLDPFYRTMEGFKKLIYKDWIYYGHNFMKCNNLGNDIQSLADQSYWPLFLLFLDCVH
jgi:hypothetical protein